MGTGRDIDYDFDWPKTDFSCTSCGDPVVFGEEVFVLTVVLAQLGPRGMAYDPLLFEDGDFLYEPHYFCINCADESLEELGALVRDIPPVEDSYAICECTSCRSGIRAGEVVAMVANGQIIYSRRSPSGQDGGSTFECTDCDPAVLCISCINKLNKEVIDELWLDPVRQYHECPEGTEIRCWRSNCSADENSDCANCKRQVG
jgi:hypothetical protein